MTEHSEEFIEAYERAAKALRENDKETILKIIQEAREERKAAAIFKTLTKEEQAAFLRL